ncbi:MAG: 30S ribosomal protein S2, partial [Acidobacteriota bacterium]
MSAISIKQLLEAGVHFGHQTSRWNPKMREYIFGERNGIHIIDLQKTLKLFKEAVDFLTDLGAQGKDILFVGTKRQAQEAVEEDAKGCGMHFVTNRWLGGLLTNFETVRKSIKRYKELEALKADGYYTRFSSKKEIAKLERERKKLEKNLRGIRNLDRLPDALFVIDSDREAIAVKEANRLGIPVIAVVDTNCDPDLVDFVIPGNDDALRSVKLFTSTIGDAVTAGRALWDAKVAEERRAREEAEREEAARAAAAKAAA